MLLNKSIWKKFNKDLAAGKVSSKALGSLSDVEIAEAMKAKVDGKDAGYVVSCSGKGYGGAVSIALGIDERARSRAFRSPIVPMRRRVWDRNLRTKSSTDSLLAPMHHRI